MEDQDARVAFLGTARLDPYLAAAAGDLERAFALYLWATEAAGAMHAQLSFVEIAVRNALDPVIADWNETQGVDYGRAWALEHQAAPQLYSLMKRELSRARSNAVKAAARRVSSHPRRGIAPTRDDVLSQMTFGSWSALIAGQRGDSARQEQFWIEVTHRAFPYAPDTVHSRYWVGDQLEEFREIRNRIAHHDNILRVNLSKRLNFSLTLLANINPDFPALATARSPLRRLIKEDPRRSW